MARLPRRLFSILQGRLLPSEEVVWAAPKKPSLVPCLFGVLTAVALGLVIPGVNALTVSLGGLIGAVLFIAAWSAAVRMGLAGTWYAFTGSRFFVIEAAARRVVTVESGEDAPITFGWNFAGTRLKSVKTAISAGYGNGESFCMSLTPSAAKSLRGCLGRKRQVMLSEVKSRAVPSAAPEFDPYCA